MLTRWTKKSAIDPLGLLIIAYRNSSSGIKTITNFSKKRTLVRLSFDFHERGIDMLIGHIQANKTWVLSPLIIFVWTRRNENILGRLGIGYTKRWGSGY